jgi:hypothetical protein
MTWVNRIEKNLFQIVNLSHSLSIEESDDLLVKISEKEILGKHDLILINFDNSVIKDFRYESFSKAKMIYKVMNLTGCPVLSWSKRPYTKSFKNILQPFDQSVNILKSYEHILPIIKLFKSKVHLLIINNISCNDANNICVEVLNDTREKFIKNGIKVKTRIINHSNESDTILAYASVIGADLIGNAIPFHDWSGSHISDSTWLNLINQSDIPLYNFSR